MNGLNLHLGSNKRTLTAEMIEPLFASGLSRREVSQKLGFAYKDLSRRIAQSLSLSEAEKNGQAKYIASFLNAEVNQ